MIALTWLQLSTLTQAHEFRGIRIRAGEKLMYKELNKSPNIRFPVKVDIGMPAQKVNLIIQVILGGVDVANDHPSQRVQYGIDQGLIFQHIHRLVRCIIDCQAFKSDAVGIRNALFLSRSFAAKAWDDSPLVLQQVDKVGPVLARKLIAVDINSIETLGQTDPGRVQHIAGRNPPFGHVMVSKAKIFPKLRVGIKMCGQPASLVRPRLTYDKQC